MQESSSRAANGNGERGSPDLTEVLDALLRFGGLTLRAGTTAFRVRQWMGTLARAMGCEAVTMHIALGGITATVRRGGACSTLASEVAPIGVDAWRIAALERLAQDAEPVVSPREIEARLDAIEAEPPLYSAELIAIAVAAASAAFSFLNGGAGPEMVAAAVGSGIGQRIRSALFGRRLNQYATTAFCAVAASSLYCLTTAALAHGGFPAARHSAGFISSVLFLVPGFPLVACLLDLLQHQVTAALTRLAYAVMILLAAAFGLCLVAGIAGLSPEPPVPERLSEPLLLLGRGLASAAGGCGFAILYNSSWRVVAVVGGLALLGNELRLALHGLGAGLATATFLGALAVGVMASVMMRGPQHEARIALTVPGIIIMVPGIYGFQTVVLFNEGEVLAALHAAVLGCFVVGAMALGLAAARFVLEPGWLKES